MLKSRIILGVGDKRLQSHFICMNPEFPKLVEICKTRERSKEQVAAIQSKERNAGECEERKEA